MSSQIKEPSFFSIPSGLYGITPDWDDTKALLQGIESAIAGGMRVLQLRRKTPDIDKIRQQALAIQPLCATHGVAFFINDHVDIAAELNVGVHLGASDANAIEVRTAHPNMPIGLSCYNDITNVILAQQINASYIAFGAIFPSTTKPNAIPASVDILRQARKSLPPQSPMKIVAIGGISTKNASLVWEAGADLIAVISQLFEHGDITENAMNLLQNFTRKT